MAFYENTLVAKQDLTEKDLKNLKDQYSDVINNSSGNVITLAGTEGVSGYTDAQGTSAKFNWPKGISIDSYGNIYVADTENHLIRKIDSSGNVTTLAGSAGVSGSTNGQDTAAMFNKPNNCYSNKYKCSQHKSYNNVTGYCKCIRYHTKHITEQNKHKNRKYKGKIWFCF